MALMTDINAGCYLMYHHLRYQVDMLMRWSWNEIINLFMLWNWRSVLMQLQRNMKNKTKGSLQKTHSTVDAESRQHVTWCYFLFEQRWRESKQNTDFNKVNPLNINILLSSLCSAFALLCLQVCSNAITSKSFKTLLLCVYGCSQMHTRIKLPAAALKGTLNNNTWWI